MIARTLFASVIASMAIMANAADYPAKDIVIITPFPPGSTSDTIPRLVASVISKSMGRTVVVENRPGANGSIGATRVARAEPDGYTLLLATTGVLAINPWIYPKLQYSPQKDFAPIINAAYTPNALVVHPSVKANSLQELIELAKAEPGKLTFASAGNGSTSHLCGETLQVEAGVDLVHVPYQGPAPAMQDVLAGRVTMMCDNLSNVVPYIEAGRLRGIAVTSKDPSPTAPGLPTSVDAGLPGLEAGNWYGFLAPAGTPKPVIDKLNAEIAKALHDPAVKTKLEEVGLTIVADTPEHFASYIESQSARMENVVKLSGASIE